MTFFHSTWNTNAWDIDQEAKDYAKNNRDIESKAKTIKLPQIDEDSEEDEKEK
jgi:hypothetical protein